MCQQGFQYKFFVQQVPVPVPVANSEAADRKSNTNLFNIYSTALDV